jgi:hypothetical protein
MSRFIKLFGGLVTLYVVILLLKSVRFEEM